MKVDELIEKLKKYPPDQLVVLSGYEGGCTDVAAVEEIDVALNVYEEDWQGPHEKSAFVENKALTKAVLIGRKGP